MTDLDYGASRPGDMLAGSAITLTDLLKPRSAEDNDPTRAGVRDARAVIREVREGDPQQD